MKSVRLIFYPLYIITILFVMIISFDIYQSITLLQKMGIVRYLSDLPHLGRNLLVFVAIMMTIELILTHIGNYLIRRLDK